MDDDEVRLFDCVAVPIFVLNIDGAGRPVYTVFNRTARRLSGLLTSDIIGKTAEDIYPGRFGKIAYQHHLDAIGSAVETTYELNLPIAGVVRRIRTTLAPLLNEAGEVVRLVGTSTDIGAEQLIRETQINAETLSSEMEQFVSMAAHDLRSPLRSISLLAGMLREDFEDLGDGKIELLDRLEHVASKTMALISDVLAHAQATTVEQRQSHFDFGELCSDILAVLDPMACHEASYDSGQIEGDQTATQIVLRNLIDNAFKHGGRDHVALSITLNDIGGDMFQVTICDNGQGFKDPALVFLDSGEYQGDSGFGLMGIRRLIRARGGRISAKPPEHCCATAPKDGCGAVVEFTLPGHVDEISSPRKTRAVSLAV